MRPGHPAAEIQASLIIEKLLAVGKVSEKWLNTYSVRQIETKERTLKERKKDREEAAKVVNIKDSRRSPKKATAPTAG